MIDILIAFIHLLLISFTAVYVFCIKDNDYDYIYLEYLYFVLLHWTFLKGECIMSYFFKKMRNSDYKLGSDFIYDDLNYLLSGYEMYLSIILQILIIVNIYMVCKRNNIKNYIIYIFIIFFISFCLIYSFCISYFTNHHKNTNYQLVNNILQIIIIFFGLYIYTNKDNIYE
jgi:hypothetical protein